MPITNWRSLITKPIVPTADLGITPDESTPLVFPDDTKMSLALLVGLRADTGAPIVVRTNADGTIGSGGGGGSMEYASVKRSTTQSMPHGADTTVIFESLVAGETWWSSGDNTKVKPGSAGIYHVSFGAYMVCDPGFGWRILNLCVNGSIVRQSGVYGNEPLQYLAAGSGIVVLGATDYLQLTGSNTTATDGTFFSGFNYSAYLDVLRIA